MGSNLIPLFHGRITSDGKFELADAERDLRRTYFRALAGKNVEIIVRKERTKRSLDQNAYLHAVPFPLLAEEWGEDIETTKLLVLGECFGWKELRDGHRLPIKPSSAALTVEEASHLIEWLPPWAMVNFRVEIPLPREVAA